MLAALFTCLFGCQHARLTFIHSKPRKPKQIVGDHYCVCLDCGREFAYDWQTMRRGEEITERIPLTDSTKGGYSVNVSDGLKRPQVSDR